MKKKLLAGFLTVLLVFCLLPTVALAAPPRTITFDPNGGTVTPTTMQTLGNGTLPSLPTPTRADHSFAGWYTAAEGGAQVNFRQVYTENTTLYAHWVAYPAPLVQGFYFESDPAAEGWTFVDSDGDGYNWTWGYSTGTEYSLEGAGAILSNSYVNYVGAVTPDNWAVSPAVTLPAGAAMLSLWAKGQDETDATEHFAIYAGETADITEMTRISGSADLVTTNRYQRYTADLSAFAGKTVYIAIRHYNCTDQFILVIDQVQIFGANVIPITNLAITAEVPLAGAAPAATITVEATLAEALTQTSFPAVWWVATESDLSDAEPMTAATFEAGKYYVLDWPNDPYISNAVAAGYNLTASTNVTFNGTAISPMAPYLAVFGPLAETYTVTFDPNGHGTPPITTLLVEEGKTIWDFIDDDFDNVRIPDVDGYDFYDYSLEDDNDPAKWFDFDTPITEDITLYAIWIPSFTVSFNSNGGTGTMADITDCPALVTLPANGFTAPTDQQFKAWALGSAAGEQYQPGEDVALDFHTTFYAVWEDIPADQKDLDYIDVTTPPDTLVYPAGDAFDPTGMVVTATYTDGTTAEVTGYVISPTGALGLYDSYVTVSYTEGGVTKTVAVPITVYQAYTVTFDAQGGTGAPESARTNEDGKLDTLPSPIQPLHLFVGWYDMPSGGTEITLDTVFTADTTIYAQWAYMPTTVSNYTLIFETNGGSAIPPATRLAGTVIDLSGYVPTREGYTFAGWYADAALTVPVTEVTLNADTTVYAKWTAIVTDLPFIDVHEDDYYYDAVKWAVENGITTGTTETTFSPFDICTRAQVVTFLWREAGSPVVSGPMPFVDVAADAYYCEAVRWAFSRGVTIGTSDTTFSPDLTITRGQAAAMLYRRAGSPAVSGTMPYTDVPETMYYYDAILWAAQQGITNGTSTATFTPDAGCTRAHIITFLYRALGK